MLHPENKAISIYISKPSIFPFARLEISHSDCQELTAETPPRAVLCKICALRQMVVMVDIITDVKRSVHSKTYWCIGGSLQGALLLKPKAPVCVHAGGPACMRACKREREQEREMKVRGVKRMIVLLFKLSEFHH